MKIKKKKKNSKSDQMMLWAMNTVCVFSDENTLTCSIKYPKFYKLYFTARETETDQKREYLANKLTAVQVGDESAADELPAHHENATVSTVEPQTSDCLWNTSRPFIIQPLYFTFDE